MSKQNEKPKAKKGMVINRRNNRTVPQGVAGKDGKWMHTEHGVLKLKGEGKETAFIKMVGNKHRSVSADGSHDYNPEGSKRLDQLLANILN